jgi:hypothetical protein
MNLFGASPDHRGSGNLDDLQEAKTPIVENLV